MCGVGRGLKQYTGHVECKSCDEPERHQRFKVQPIQKDQNIKACGAMGNACLSLTVVQSMRLTYLKI